MTRPLFVLILMLPFAAAAEAPLPLGKVGVWESFSSSEKGGKVCFMTSQPRQSLGAGKNHKAFLTITHRQSDKSVGVVSVTQGGPFRKDASLILDIEGQRFDLYADGDTAWTRNDKAVLAALQKGKSAVMHGTPAKGDAVADNYALDGFAKAYATISQACGLH